MLCQLCDDGFFNMPYPDAMIGYSAKDALVKLTSMILLLTIHSNSSLSSSLRKGSAYSSKIADLQVKGFGVSIVEVEADFPHTNTKIYCTEAKDNHVEYWELGAFIGFCEKYIY